MISAIDLGVIALYFSCVAIIAVVVARKTKTGDDLFLGGRSLTWPFIGMSLFASNINSTVLIGLAGAAYMSGFAQSVYEWTAGISYIILAMIFIPLYLTTRMTTIPEFLEGRYDRRSRLFYSAAIIFTSIMVTTAGGLYAGAVVLQLFFPDLELWHTCLVLALIAGAYTSMGGLKAVVYIDSLQTIVLLCSCTLLTYFMFKQVDFSWSTVVAAAPAGHFSIIKPLNDPVMPWLGMIFVPFLATWYIATNQFITQRVLAARSIRDARLGAMLAGYLKFLPFFIMLLPGAMAITLLPDLENPDMVFPMMVLEFLPVGVVGLVFAGLIAAILSSIDSTLNSSSTLIVVDFISSKHPDMTPTQVAKYGRIATVILMLIAALWAPNIGKFGGLWVYLQQIFSIIVAPAIALFLLGAFYKRGNASGAFWTLILGTVIGFVALVLRLNGIWPLHFLMNMGVLIALCCVIFVLVSQFSPAPAQEVIDRFTFKKEYINLDNEDVRWYEDYRVHCGIILFITVLFVIGLW